MAHQCVKCGKIYDNAAPEILKGCSSCGSHYFFFFKEKDVEIQQQTERLSIEDREEIVQDLQELVPEIDKPVILDLESIRVPSPGKFEIDLVGLFRKKPIIYKLEEGKYMIDLASTFQILRKDK
jgi:predicted  nucleic acid-binding Zn-ribbon protein